MKKKSRGKSPLFFKKVVRKIVKIYLASSFDLKDKVGKICSYLENFDIKKNKIEITSRWWEFGDKKKFKYMSDDEWYQLPMIEEVYSRAFKGIEEADALILVCPDDKTKKFNGANVELGIALAEGKKILSIGKLERSGMYKDVIRCKGVADIIDELGIMKNLNMD